MRIDVRLGWHRFGQLCMGGRHAAMKTEQEFIVDGRTAFTIYKTVDKISNRK